MPKYRKTICQDTGFSKGMWFIAPIDLRKKFYFCNNCQKEHLVKEGVVKDENLKKNKIPKTSSSVTSISPLPDKLQRRLIKNFEDWIIEK